MTTRTYSVALTEELHRDLLQHLIRDDGQEDLCFALWYPSEGATRTTALLRQLVLPAPGDRFVHGNASFTAEYFERALMLAVQEQAGLAFLHNHLGRGWQDMSPPDVRAELGHAAPVQAATGLPFLGLTTGTDGAWSARFWVKDGPSQYNRHWCTHVRVVGDGLTVTWNDSMVPSPPVGPELTRTVCAWGPKAQGDIARLHAGIAGLGSVGGIIGESLARTGFGHLTLIDYDRFEILNLDRSLHARRIHAAKRMAKVEVIAAALQESATARDFDVRPIDGSIVEEDGYRAALDCDVLFSCVDRPWARSVLNFIAYAHLIPVVDGGIRVNTSRAGLLTAADWRAHIAGPGRRCLACNGQYDPALVAVERDGFLDDPKYIQGLPLDHVARRNENVFAFSLNTAGLQVLQMLAMTLAPLGIANIGEQMYHFVPGILDAAGYSSCDPTCLFPGLAAMGDRTGISVTGRDIRAAALRDGVIRQVS